MLTRVNVSCAHRLRPPTLLLGTTLQRLAEVCTAENEAGTSAKRTPPCVERGDEHQNERRLDRGDRRHVSLSAGPTSRVVERR
jgi:hypothetical protein